MDKASVPSLFVNDGSFMERFKQLQKEKDKKNEILDTSKSASGSAVTAAPKTIINKTKLDFKKTSSQDPPRGVPSGGKLAFSLKQKSKLVTPPVKFVDDEDEDKDAGNVSDDAPFKRPKLDKPDSYEWPSKQVDVALPSASDPTVERVADKLASFVAKHGRQFEHVTRQKNPGDTPFKFLFDESCSDYKYYEYRLSLEEKALSQTRESQTLQSGTASSYSSAGSRKSHHHQSKYQTPASALDETTSNAGSTPMSSHA
ncbi:hypothetical protein M569_05990, partial [Genlisea aurea]